MKNNESKNYFKPLFVAFLILGGLIFIGPFLIYIPFIREIAKYYLDKLGGLKGDYLNMLGATIGAGLALSSALWLQKNESNKKEIENKEYQKKQKQRAARFVYEWFNREIEMLWGMWIWSTFEDAYSYTRIPLYFEPYVVQLDKVLDDFLIIEKEMPNSSAFYDLYYFSVKVNLYITNYNSLNYDTPIINSDSSYGSTSIHTDVTNNSSCIKYKEILKYLIRERQNFLFFESDIDIMTKQTVLEKKDLLHSKYNQLENDLTQICLNEYELSEDRASMMAHRLINSQINIPDSCKDIVKSTKDIKQQSKELDDIFYSNVKSWVNELNNAKITSSLNEFKNELFRLSKD